MSSKKLPMRKCVGCAEMKPKKELIRLVRKGEEEFVLDQTGRQNGRGAYLCPTLTCFTNAVKKKGFERSFGQKIPEDVYHELEKEMSIFEQG